MSKQSLLRYVDHKSKERGDDDFVTGALPHGRAHSLDRKRDSGQPNTRTKDIADDRRSFAKSLKFPHRGYPTAAHGPDSKDHAGNKERANQLHVENRRPFGAREMIKPSNDDSANSSLFNLSTFGEQVQVQFADQVYPTGGERARKDQPKNFSDPDVPRKIPNKDSRRGPKPDKKSLSDDGDKPENEPLLNGKEKRNSLNFSSQDPFADDEKWTRGPGYNGTELEDVVDHSPDDTMDNFIISMSNTPSRQRQYTLEDLTIVPSPSTAPFKSTRCTRNDANDTRDAKTVLHSEGKDQLDADVHRVDKSETATNVRRFHRNHNPVYDEPLPLQNGPTTDAINALTTPRPLVQQKMYSYPSSVDHDGDVQDEPSTHVNAYNANIQLDYSPDELRKRAYETLDTDPFVFDPRARVRPPVVDSNGNNMSLASRLGNLSRISHDDQRALFASQTDEEWQATSKWFLDKFTTDMKKLMDVRAERRKLALKWEAEVRKRQARIEREEELLNEDLRGLKKGGGELIKDRSVNATPLGKRKT